MQRAGYLVEHAIRLTVGVSRLCFHFKSVSVVFKYKSIMCCLLVTLLDLFRPACGINENKQMWNVVFLNRIQALQ